MPDIQYPLEPESEGVLVLETGWFPDYSRPPKVGRRWIKEGTKINVTMVTAKLLKGEGLVLDSTADLPKRPDDLDYPISLAAFRVAQRANMNVSQLRNKGFAGTGVLGMITLNDVTNYLRPPDSQ